MTLDEYMKSDDGHTFWNLLDGAKLNLLDEAIERLQATEKRLEIARAALKRIQTEADSEWLARECARHLRDSDPEA